jgi:hypothetical protein
MVEGAGRAVTAVVELEMHPNNGNKKSLKLFAAERNNGLSKELKESSSQDEGDEPSTVGRVVDLRSDLSGTTVVS